MKRILRKIERVRIRRGIPRVGRDVYQPATKDRVYYWTDPAKALGTVMAAGPEQSWVKWDYGYDQAEPNTRLRKHIGIRRL